MLPQGLPAPFFLLPALSAEGPSRLSRARRRLSEDAQQAGESAPCVALQNSVYGHIAWILLPGSMYGISTEPGREVQISCASRLVNPNFGGLGTLVLVGTAQWWPRPFTWHTM